MNFKIRTSDCHKNNINNPKLTVNRKSKLPQKSKMNVILFIFLLFKMTGDAEYNNKATANYFL